MHKMSLKQFVIPKLKVAIGNYWGHVKRAESQLNSLSLGRKGMT